MIEGATKRKLEKISKGELDDLKDMVLKDKDDDVVDEIEELYEDENDERCVTNCLFRRFFMILPFFRIRTSSISFL